MEIINIAEKLDSFSDHWSPKIIAELNGQHVRLSKFKGEFIVVPKGVEHKPSAEEEVSVLMFEPASARNTGNIDEDFLKRHL